MSTPFEELARKGGDLAFKEAKRGIKKQIDNHVAARNNLWRDSIKKTYKTKFTSIRDYAEKCREYEQLKKTHDAEITRNLKQYGAGLAARGLDGAAKIHSFRTKMSSLRDLSVGALAAVRHGISEPGEE